MSLNVEILEQSFEKIKPSADEFAASFYEKLFTAHPELKPLFAKTDMEKQQKKLISTLVLVVENLRSPEALGPVLNALGGRHIGYGVIPKYYRPVGEALLSAFEQYLQQDWTMEVKQAWIDAYGAITALMLKGAGVVSTPEEVQLETEIIPDKQVSIAANHQLESVPEKEPELAVEVLESSFEKIKPRADEFAASFYENLFIAHPEFKPLFANIDIEKQQKKLLNALVLVVENLRSPEALGPVLNTLGGRHVSYGAIANFYPAVGEALLMTFEEYLQEDWTIEVKQAWIDAYGAITALMLKGAGVVSTPEQVQLETEIIPDKQVSIAANHQLESVPEKEPELAVEVLESSFEKIKLCADEFAASFYENLFIAHPEFKPLFANIDLEKQQKKLINALVLVVENLRSPEALGPVLKALGGRHIGYGVIPKYYGPVGDALLMRS